MRKTSALFLVVATLAAVPALAGTLTFDNGQTAWHSTQCAKPTPPGSVLSANPETAGEDMNNLVNLHNAFVDAAQAYMNCIGSEAEHDQNMANQAILGSAQKAIVDMQEEVSKSARPLRAKSKE